METTRHFTATTYVVNDGATALHAHERLGIRLPPGGHVDRDELPHEAALREIREETGLEAELVATESSIEGPNTRGLPEPAHLMLHDINVHEDGSVGHQHVDHLYYAPGRLSRNRAERRGRGRRRRGAGTRRGNWPRATSSGT